VRWIALLIFIAPQVLFAHEIQSVSQHINLRRQNQSGWQQDVIARIRANRKFDVGAQATYFDRFNIFDKRVGGLLTYRPSDLWTFEARYLQGKGNEILPEKETILSAYHSTQVGISPYFYYKDSRYSVTHLHTANIGVEIEKFQGFIIIPSFTLGRATFKSPGETKDVHNYGLRVTYYQEKKYGVSLFTYAGKEASQAVIGRSSVLVSTLTGGAAFTWYFSDDFKSELTFDHTDYDELKTEFHTTTLNLSWMF
jgi:hypothetical protein